MIRSQSPLPADWLPDEHIGAVSLVPGMEIDPFLLQLAETEGLRTVVATHEAAAGFIAEGLRQHFLAATDAMRQLPFAPAYLCVPYDIQEAKESHRIGRATERLSPLVKEADGKAKLERIVPILAAAKTIVFLAGTRAVLSDASEALRSFTERFEIPVATILSAKGTPLNSVESHDPG